MPACPLPPRPTLATRTAPTSASTATRSTASTSSATAALEPPTSPSTCGPPTTVTTNTLQHDAHPPTATTTQRRQTLTQSHHPLLVCSCCVCVYVCICVLCAGWEWINVIDAGTQAGFATRANVDFAACMVDVNDRVYSVGGSDVWVSTNLGQPTSACMLACLRPLAWTVSTAGRCCIAAADRSSLLVCFSLSLSPLCQA